MLFGFLHSRVSLRKFRWPSTPNTAHFASGCRYHYLEISKYIKKAAFFDNAFKVGPQTTSEHEE